MSKKIEDPGGGGLPGGYYEERMRELVEAEEALLEIETEKAEAVKGYNERIKMAKIKIQTMVARIREDEHQTRLEV